MSMLRRLGLLLAAGFVWVTIGVALRSVGLGPVATFVVMFALLFVFGPVLSGIGTASPSPEVSAEAAALSPPEVARAAIAPHPLSPTCGTCRKEIGLDWHYLFESIELAGSVAAQCPTCGVFTCRDDLAYGADGNYQPCSTCGVAVEGLYKGPASASLVRHALAHGRYYGVMKSPSAQGRAVEQA